MREKYGGIYLSDMYQSISLFTGQCLRVPECEIEKKIVIKCARKFGLQSIQVYTSGSGRSDVDVKVVTKFRLIGSTKINDEHEETGLTSEEEEEGAEDDEGAGSEEEEDAEEEGEDDEEEEEDDDEEEEEEGGGKS
jgi:hypothetical protein